ncbi:DUF3800 domain-containing protein [Candidatus Accumulibacter cognatus]|uniref:DUF3800 domain-containing protein n=1 Tax=Candidatus Accumulibacter cognatus TaxID=2954383 RepID=A0A080M262_9PROT|nr:DUF3800 domain-containing protein [Candidatus Accumulibacter cognatus]KFB75348.1 MAG: hypothetical protein AW06_003623 [Candidatus Accumulibacter cognatus]
MNPPDPPSTLHFFVDEAGDPTLFDAKGRILVGQEGCSKTFILGKLDVEDPAALHAALAQLRADLLADPYFKRVPSMQAERGKTARAFHAKDDVPEVRREVFRVLMRFDLRFYGVVRHKAALLDYVRQRNDREAGYRYRGDELYDTLVEELFRRYHPLTDRLEICFATRGNKSRTHAFRSAIEKAETRFESQYGIRRSAAVAIVASTPPQKAGLQAVDYFLWALQRHYERGESRYIELVWDKVVEIEDLDHIEGRRKGVLYNKRRPLIVGQEVSE